MGSYQQFLSSNFYLLGTFLLIPGSVLSLAGLPQFALLGVYFFIVATSFLVAAAIVDLFCAIRGSVGAKTETDPEKTALIQETEGEVKQGGGTGSLTLLNSTVMYAVAMFIGGVLFLTASVLYLWASTANTGTWVFRVGSCSYLCGSAISLHTMHWSSEPGPVSLATKVWTFAVLQYVVGAILYIIGGVISQVEVPGFAVSWLMGSILFFSGSFTVSFEIFREMHEKISS
mmetsp:Transcript_29046/g.81261  ORF Transcript_29046/g.81261 Transcript_29046/m.81261 type:complete len:230 (+) Transcript_29046:111-800(+)